MSLTYRWEKGAPLTSEEADENIRILHEEATTVVPRPVKDITSADLVGGVYTLEIGDEKEFLVFNIAAAFQIKVPAGIFINGAGFEGATIGDGKGTFTSASGVDLLYGASELNKTAEKNSVFGMKFIASNKVLLFGKLELV